MAAPRSTAKPATKDAPSATDPAWVELGYHAGAAPPYYIAVEALFIGDNQFNRAHNAGDRVPADHVDKYGWADSVRPPDGYEPAPDLPETPDGGQASAEGKDA